MDSKRAEAMKAQDDFFHEQDAHATIGLFGGSFDPPHVGHVLAVHYVLLTAPVSRVFVVPCAEHPFGKKHVSFEHRLAMCRLAFANLGEAVEVLDIESGRSGPSYTIDTVRELTKLHPGARFELIVGTDIPRELPKWKDAEELRKIADFRVLPRLEDNTANAEEEQEISFYLPRISSSTIRRMAGEGGDLSPHVPRAVLEYIERQGLYR